MTEIFVDSRHGEIGLEEWGQVLGRFPRYADRAIASALKQEGYRIRQIIKLSIKAGGPEGSPWPRLSPHTEVIRLSYAAWRRQARKGAKSRRTKWQRLIASERHIERETQRKPLAKLAGASRYVYHAEAKTVTIGFLDPKNKGLAKMHATGFRTPVTPRRRRMLFAAGMPLSRGTAYLQVPPRPVVGPVFRAEAGSIQKNVAFRALDNLTRYVAGRYKMTEAA